MKKIDIHKLIEQQDVENKQCTWIKIHKQLQTAVAKLRDTSNTTPQENCD